MQGLVLTLRRSNNGCFQAMKPSHTNLATKKTWLARCHLRAASCGQRNRWKPPNGNNAVDWDNAAKCWYANPEADLDKLKPWIATEIMSRQVPALSPEKNLQRRYEAWDVS